MRIVAQRKVLAILVLAASISLIVTAAVATAAGEDDSPTTTVLGHEIARDRVSIPGDWGAPDTKALKVRVAYDGEDIIFRSQFPADKPGIHHD